MVKETYKICLSEYLLELEEEELLDFMIAKGLELPDELKEEKAVAAAFVKQHIGDFLQDNVKKDGDMYMAFFGYSGWNELYQEMGDILEKMRLI